MSIRRLLLAAMSAVCLLALAGCWQTIPINRRSLVFGVAVDPGPRKGLLHFTFQMPTPTYLESLGGQGGGSGGSQGPPFFTIATDARSFGTAIVQAENTSSRDLYLGQLQFVLLSTKLSPEDLSTFLDEEGRTGELDHTEYLLATDRSASTLASTQVVQEPLPSLYIQSHFSCPRCTESHLPVEMYQALSILNEPTADLALPLLETQGKDLLTISRMVIYRALQPAAIFTQTETRGWAWITGRITKEDMAFNTSFGSASVRSISGTTTVRTQRDPRGRPYLTISIKAQGSISGEPTSGIGSPGLRPEIAEKSALAIREQVVAALEKARSVGSEPFGLGPAIKSKDPAVFGSPETWRQNFQRLPVAVHVAVTLTGTGVKP